MTDHLVSLFDDEISREKIDSSKVVTLCLVLHCLLGCLGFLSKLGSDRTSPMQMQVLFTVGMVPLGLAAIIQHGLRVDSDRLGVTYGILNGVFTGLGLLAYYAALARGKASIVGPVTALFPLLTVGLAFFILKERMNRIQLVGMAFALAAIFILSQ